MLKKKTFKIKYKKFNSVHQQQKMTIYFMSVEFNLNTYIDRLVISRDSTDIRLHTVSLDSQFFLLPLCYFLAFIYLHTRRRIYDVMSLVT